MNFKIYNVSKKVFKFQHHFEVLELLSSETFLKSDTFYVPKCFFIENNVLKNPVSHNLDTTATYDASKPDLLR